MFGNRKKREKVELSKESYKRAGGFLRFLKPYSGIYTVGWLFLVFSSLTAMLFPALMGQLIGANPEEEPIFDLGSIDLNDINMLLIVMLVVFGTQAFFSFFQ